VWTYFQRGGPVMWPLLILSIVALAVVIWRWLALRNAARNSTPMMTGLRQGLLEGDVMAAIEVCDRYPSAVSNIVRAGLMKVGRPKDEVQLSLQDASAHELAVLERGLPVLGTIAVIAPLLGFLGTVTGMINSFDALAAVGLNNPAAVAAGISQALITTATGLAIAIPVQTAYNYFVARVNGTVRSMESAANLVIEALTDADVGRIDMPRASDQDTTPHVTGVPPGTR
jgi:biopolymer transport protein ExbB